MKRTNRRSKQSSPIDASASASNEKQQLEERIRELERENRAYQVEIGELRQKHENNLSASDNGVEKLKRDYFQKLDVLEQEVTELRRKLDSRSQFSTKRKGVDETTKQLQFEIQSLKAQKVQLQCKIKLDSVQFRLHKASLEKEVHQLKKERRRNEYEVKKLLASNQRLKMVLQRKTVEASTATKRLKEMVEVRKAISNRLSGARHGNNKVIQATENEFEVTTHLHELCSQYETQMEQMAEQIAKLKEDTELHSQQKLELQLQEGDSECLEKDFDIEDLKEQVNNLGCLFRELQLKKEKHNFKDKMQDLTQPLFPEGSDDKLLGKIVTPETTGSSENEGEKGKTAEGVCCSCSKRSLCKTTKCKCRSIGESCGTSCGCALFRCQNREENSVDKPSKSDSGNVTDETHDRIMIAPEGVNLLQNALVEKPADFTNNPGPMKKPLCDIQNSLGNLDAQRAGKKKRGRKPAIQLVTKDPYSSLPEGNVSTDEANNSEAAQANNPMTYRVSNSGQPNESATVINDAAVTRNLRNATRQAKVFMGKENCLLPSS